MPPTAKIYRNKKTPFWQAWFMAWDAKKQAWRPITKTTKVTDQAKALTIARQFEAAAQQAAGAAQSGDRISREHITGVINTILTIAGLPQHVETRQWDEYSQEWLALQKTRIAARSLESYEGHIRLLTRWLGPEKSSPLNAMDGGTLQDWYFDMLDEGRKPATVNNAVKTIQAVFDRARAEGFCPRNPAELVLRQYGEADIRQPFTQDDLAKILSHLRRTGQTDWLTVMLLGICTGQRLQDCAGVTSTEITPATKKTPRVWHNKQGKTGTLVHIPIIEPLESHLQTLQMRPGKPLAAALAGTPSGGNNGLSEQFSGILDAAGVERQKREKTPGSKGQSWTDKTFHSFRHTTNTLLAEAGIPYEVRKDITGHSSAAMNERYTHRAASTLATALQRAITSAVSL
jgi:integrase